MSHTTEHLADYIRGLAAREQSDRMRESGHLRAEVIRDGPHGPVVIQRRDVHNLIVLSGKKQILRLASGNQTKFFDQFRLGTSGAAATSNHTGVLSPIANTLRTVDNKTLNSGRTHQWDLSYPSGATSISATGIEEVALHNQNTSPGGSAMMRSVFSSSVNKTQDDKLKVTYTARIT